MARMEFLRTMFCESCNKASRPSLGQTYISEITSKKTYIVNRVEANVGKKNKGFTPHVVSMYKLIDERTVEMTRICGMIGCGVALRPHPETKQAVIITINRVLYENMALTDWNALISLKDLGYRL